MKSKMSMSLIAAATLLVAASAFAAEGQGLYEANCAKCHGPDGKGNTKMGLKAGAKDLSDPKLQLTDAKIANAIKAGVKEGDKTKMKAFPNLSEAEVKALVSYVHSFKK